jgi:PAS domain S-box-containing protein/putative nucleotidyltransferase with HDIG domain
MATPPTSPSLARAPAFAASIVALVGGCVLAGWSTGIEILKTGALGVATTKPNTAVCLMLAAAGLGLTTRGRAGARMARGLALAVGVVGGLSLSEYVLGVDLGIDQLLFRDAVGSLDTSRPGRMAPNTAVAFILVAVALAALPSTGRRAWLSPALSVGAAMLAVVALISYLSGLTSLYEVSRLPQMAVPTSVSFLLLAAGILCARPHDGPVALLTSDTVGGRVARSLLPAAVVVPVLMATLRLAGQGAGLYDTDTGAWLLTSAVVALLVPLTWALAASLDRGERQLRRAQAARSEAQRDRAAFDESPIGAVLYAVDGRVMRVNRALCAMLGYLPEEILGRDLASLTHPDDRAADARASAEMRAGTRRSYETQKRYLHRDGRVVYGCVCVTPIYDADGMTAQFYAQVQDVTEARVASHRLEEAQFEILSRLAAAAEYRDDDTGEHTRRVGELAGRLAERLGLSAEETRLIRLAAPLHDVGKIGIPDAILLKPGRLTRREFETIKSHTTIGAEMLAGGAFPLLARAEEIARTHHERWDGSGYPAGLAGEEIPMAGRIVAIVDVFDALTHDRPYKDAWTVEDAVAEIERQRGRHFDPRVVDAFLATLERPGMLAADEERLSAAA